MEIVAFTLAGLCTILTLLILAPLLYAGFRLFAAPLLRLPRARPRSLVGASDRRGALAAALLCLALGSIPLRLWLTDTPGAAPSALAWQLAVGLLCVCAAALLLQDAQALRGLGAAWGPAPVGAPPRRAGSGHRRRAPRRGGPHHQRLPRGAAALAHGPRRCPRRLARPALGRAAGHRRALPLPRAPGGALSPRRRGGL